MPQLAWSCKQAEKVSLFLQRWDFFKTEVNFNDGINKDTSTHSNALDEKGHLFTEFVPCQLSEFSATVTIYLAPILYVIEVTFPFQ